MTTTPAAARATVGQKFVDPTDGEVYIREANGWSTPTGRFFYSLGATVALLVGPVTEPVQEVIDWGQYERFMSE